MSATMGEYREMPPGGVKELVKSPSGRAYLEKLRERHKHSLYQPGSPEFERVYRPKLKQQEEVKRRQEADSRSRWQEIKDRRKKTSH